MNEKSICSCYKKFLKYMESQSLRKDEKCYNETFIIKIGFSLSKFTQGLLENCANKPFYQVLETIEYCLKFNEQERSFLLETFYSIAISLQNNTKVNFYDIQIYNINFKKICHVNKINNHLIETQYLRVNCYFTVKPPKKKKQPKW